MRGKDTAGYPWCSQPGITPAYAGKSDKPLRSHFVFRDHPRLCGEKVRLSKKTRFWAGSPPPMRGKVARKMPEWYEDRITPAYAGKSINGTNEII